MVHELRRGHRKTIHFTKRVHGQGPAPSSDEDFRLRIGAEAQTSAGYPAVDVVSFDSLTSSKSTKDPANDALKSSRGRG